MAKKPDFKGLLLNWGEMIALGVAGTLTLLVLLMTLLPGLASGSADENANKLNQKATAVARLLVDASREPSPGDLPAANSAKNLVDPALDPIDGAQFRLQALIAQDSGAATARGVPQIYSIEEAEAAAGPVSIQEYIFTRANSGDLQIRVLKGEAGESSSGGLGGTAKKIGGLIGKGGGVPPAGFAGGSGRGGEGGGGGGSETQELSTRSAKKYEDVKILDLAKYPNATFAEQVAPVHMAVIAASFPYKKQIEEFQNKLRLGSPDEVLGEFSQETDAKRQNTLRSFRFQGVLVQRRELDREGKGIGDWKDVDLFKDYTLHVYNTGKRFDEDDPDLKNVSFPGLVMKKLMQFRPENIGKDTLSGTSTGMGGPAGGGEGVMKGGPSGPMPPGTGTKGTSTKGKIERLKDRYPPVERALTKLKATLKELEGKTVTVAAPPAKFDTTGFDPFNPEAAAEDKTSGGGGTTEEGMGMGIGSGKNPGENQQTLIPEYCLVRVIDVTVEPGKAYEYRLKIRMANPNYKRKNVANPAYSTAPALESEWSAMPIRVRLDDQLFYYAVDQRALDRAKNPPKGLPAFRPSPSDTEVVLQAHRFLDEVKINDRVPLTVGEWGVADRFTVYRGEYIGRTLRVELPVWRYTREDFAIAADKETSTQKPGIPVKFGYETGGTRYQPEALMVDFTSGMFGYERITSRPDEEKQAKTRVTDVAAVEALIMTPDGKLQLLEGSVDAVDEKRILRQQSARARVDDLKNAKEQKANKGGGGLTGN